MAIYGNAGLPEAPSGERKPSWLSDRGSLAATLPSRRGLNLGGDEDEASPAVRWGTVHFYWFFATMPRVEM